MYDFDHFKKINDTHGHIIGDRVLYKAAHIVVSQLRPSDYAYRLGGEEFAVMVHDASVNDVQSIAERIRHAIEWDKFKVDEYSLPHVTVSLGFSRVRGSDTHFEDVLLRADEALYLSKSSSRNTISHR